MEKKQLYKNKEGEYSKFYPLVDLNTVLDSSDDKTLSWIILGYNHLYIEWRESVPVTRDEIPLVLRHNGLFITYNNGSEVITEYYCGSNSDVSNYEVFTNDKNWVRIPSIDYLLNHVVIPEGSILPAHLSDTLQQLIADSDVTIQNFPDEEDITQQGLYLKFRNRAFMDDNKNGLGYKIIRKNFTVINSQVVNKLPQDAFSSESTIYEIRYDFDLDGGAITIPANSVLYFNGGSLRNGSIDFNDCHVIGTHKCFYDITAIDNLQEIEVEWFGVNTESNDISADFNALVSALPQGSTDKRSTLKFKGETYTTLHTLIVNKQGINIVGNPTFYNKGTNITCIKISGASIQQFELSVRADSPCDWSKNDHIGVLLENCTNCKFEIPVVSYHTYGIVCRADGAGFGWNNLYVGTIRSALQSFVVEALNSGWPNANNVWGGMFVRLTGTFNKTNVTEPCRDVVFKSDGTYGANAWNFEGLWFETKQNLVINDEQFYFFDFCNYINGKNVRGINIRGCRFELYVSDAYIKIDNLSRAAGVSNSSINFTDNSSFGSVSTVMRDRDGNVAPQMFYSNAQRNYKFLEKIVNYDDDELVGAVRLSKGSKYLGYGTNGKLTRRFGGYGYYDKSLCLTNFEGIDFQIAINGRVHIYFLDETLTPVALEDVNWQHWNVAGLFTSVTTTRAQYINNTSDVKTVLEFTVLDAGPAKYIVFGANASTRLELRYNNSNVIPPNIVNPLGYCGADTYSYTVAIGTLRSTFEVGDKYYDETNNILYEFLTSGSLGTITATTANGTTGDSFVTVDSVGSLYVGDYILLDSVKYKVISIDTENLKLFLSKPLESNLSNAPIALSAPVYRTITA